MRGCCNGEYLWFIILIVLLCGCGGCGGRDNDCGCMSNPPCCGN